MNIHSLLIGTNVHISTLVQAAFASIPSIQCRSIDTVEHAVETIETQAPKIIVIDFGNDPEQCKRFFSLMQKQNIQPMVLPVLDNPTPEMLQQCLKKKGVIDILDRNADSDRINGSLQKILDKLGDQDPTLAHYRGFVNFIGVTPTMQDRKILQKSRMGIIQNRSVRFAIDYWRENPNVQLLALILDINQSYSTETDQLPDDWKKDGFNPWEVAMFEAQSYYTQYWKEPIEQGFMYKTVPTMLRNKSGNTDILDSKIQVASLVNIGRKTQRGDMDGLMQSLHVTQTKNPFVGKEGFTDFINTLEQTVKKVDIKFPHLTRPQQKSGYENWKPDKAGPMAKDNNRMAFTQRNRG